MSIQIQRECGCIAEDGSLVCPECGYDPDCPCCISPTEKEESWIGPPIIW
jgi:hypothetical protein